MPSAPQTEPKLVSAAIGLPPYAPILVANTLNFIFDAACLGADDLLPMRVQKLIYLAHGWHLGLGKGPLINELVQAGEFGPFIKSLKGDMSMEYGLTIIYSPSHGFTVMREKIDHQPTLDFLEEFIGVYGNYSTVQLANLANEEGSPWAQVVGGLKGLDSVPIPNEVIEKHFRQLVKS